MAESLYAKYIKEREDFEIIEDGIGFITFKITKEECYIRDVFVLPEFRKSNTGKEFANQVEQYAKARGCKFLTGTVCPRANGSTDSLNILLKCGFNLLTSDNDKIIFIKEII